MIRVAHTSFILAYSVRGFILATQSEVAANLNDSESIEVRPAYTVDDRNSLELVFGLTAPVGSGASTVARMLGELLHDDFGYEVHLIKLSELIAESSGKTSVNLADELAPDERFDRFQTAGNDLRNLKTTYVVDKAIERINLLRRENEGVAVGEGPIPDVLLQKRTVYILDSLKNPIETRRLRQIYGDLFWQISVFSPEDVRQHRMIGDGVAEELVKKIMKRDEREEEECGQQVSRTAHLADFFVRNHSDHKENLRPSLLRFLDTIFRSALSTPNADENGMMKAASAGVRSACLSRQVGAAIYDSRGELIGVGCNDVPMSGGGLYNSDLAEGDDHRCFRWGKKICHNDDRKTKMASKIARALYPDDDVARNLAFEVVRKSEAKNLIEFSRSVHAEMEAIVSVARVGKGSTVGATLYTTTFPCHNCARHIIAAGICRVVYVEPYSKSLATDLHRDAITQDDEEGKVRFVQYEGFAPRASLRVFSSAGLDRKDGSGVFTTPSRKEAKPLFHHPLDSYMNNEELVIRELSQI